MSSADRVPPVRCTTGEVDYGPDKGTSTPLKADAV